jgi:hypothetical protein
VGSVEAIIKEDLAVVVGVVTIKEVDKEDSEVATGTLREGALTKVDSVGDLKEDSVEDHTIKEEVTIREASEVAVVVATVKVVKEDLVELEIQATSKEMDIPLELVVVVDSTKPTLEDKEEVVAVRTSVMDVSLIAMLNKTSCGCCHEWYG